MMGEWVNMLVYLKRGIHRPFYRENGFSDINAMVMVSKRIEQDA